MSAFPKYVLDFAIARRLPIAARHTASGPIFYLSDGRGGAVAMGARTYTGSGRGFLAALRSCAASCAEVA
jgi:hypothetical protein